MKTIRLNCHGRCTLTACILPLLMMLSIPTHAIGPFVEITDPTEHPLPPPLTFNRPVFVDLDGDGDLDMTDTDDEGQLRYFENIGNATQPQLVERFDTDNPLAGIRGNSPNWADLDSDGDWDAVVRNNSGALLYFENIGSATQPVFADRNTPPGFPPEANTVLYTLTPPNNTQENPYFEGNFILPGADNLYAIVSGEWLNGDFSSVRLSGIADDTQSLWSDFNGYARFLHLFQASGEAIDVRIDWTSVRENITVTLADQPPLPAENPFFGSAILNSGGENTLTLASLHEAGDARLSFLDGDGDGDLDVVTGERDGILQSRTRASEFNNVGKLRYFENIGNSTQPDYLERVGTNNPLDTVDVRVKVHTKAATTSSSKLFCSPHSVNETETLMSDWENDGDLDILLSIFDGTYNRCFPVGSSRNPAVFGPTTLHYFENIGDTLNPLYIQRQGVNGPFAGILMYTSAPITTPVDLDGDSDLDLLTVMRDGTQRYYKNLSEFPGYAVLIQGRTANPVQATAYRQLADRLYQQLLNQGLAAEDIYCYTYPARGLPNHSDCQPFSSDIVSPEALQAKLNAKPGPLQAILVGPSNADGSFLTDEGVALTPAVISGWLGLIDDGLSPLAQAAPRWLLMGHEHTAQTVAALSIPGWKVLSGTPTQLPALLDALEQLPSFACAINHNRNCKPVFMQANRQLLSGQVTVQGIPNLPGLAGQLEQQPDGSFILRQISTAEPEPHAPVFEGASGLLTFPRLTVIGDTVQQLENAQLQLQSLPSDTVTRFQFAPGSPVF